MPLSLDETARQYRAAALSLAHHEEARSLSQTAFSRAQEALASVDPHHPLLAMDPAALATAGGLSLHPLHILVDILLRPTYEPVRGVPPQATLLAGSLALVQPGGRTHPDIILRRILEAVRAPLTVLEP